MIANTYVVKPFGISEVKVIALKGEPGGPTQEQVNTAVTEYMDEHPEHTIPDGSITEQKLSEDAVTTDKIADESVTTDKLVNNVTAPYADNLVSSSYVSDSEPYLFRKTFAGVREDDEIVGGSVVWNQLCNSASVTIPNGRKYFMKKGTDYSIGASTGTAITGLTSGSDMVIDLTLMFGPTVADYIYSLETATAGAGVAWCKAYNPKMFSTYQPYNAGTLMSVNTIGHKMVGFNQCDEEFVQGDINTNTGAQGTSSTRCCTKNFQRIIPSETYFCRASASVYLFFYDENKSYIGYWGSTASGKTFTPASLPNNKSDGGSFKNARYMKIRYDIYPYPEDLCINFSSSRNGQYEPYTVYSYPLDSSLTLRGLLKLDGDSIYYDGDIYKADGTVTRRYGVVDLGTLRWLTGTAGDHTFFRTALQHAAKSGINAIFGNGYAVVTVGVWNTSFPDDSAFLASTNWGSTPNLAIRDDSYSDVESFKSAMSGVYLVYELATPTIESAEPYTNPQKCYPDGEEEYIDTRDVPIPVGHNTKYMRDLKKLLEGIPDAPSANGTYVLKATVSSSGVTYAWIAG